MPVDTILHLFLSPHGLEHTGTALVQTRKIHFPFSRCPTAAIWQWTLWWVASSHLFFLGVIFSLRKETHNIVFYSTGHGVYVTMHMIFTFVLSHTTTMFFSDLFFHNYTNPSLCINVCWHYVHAIKYCNHTCSIELCSPFEKTRKSCLQHHNKVLQLLCHPN